MEKCIENSTRCTNFQTPLHAIYFLVYNLAKSCHHTNDSPVLLMVQRHAAIGWFCCLSLMAVLVGVAYVLRETPAYLSLPHALYQGLHRPLWALAVSWIILACEEGYGGRLGMNQAPPLHCNKIHLKKSKSSSSFCFQIS